MTKIKLLVATSIFSLSLFLISLPMNAQVKNAGQASSHSKKLFTLEDLNYGGRNFHNFQPENLWLTWWGDQLMYQDAEEGGTIEAKTEKGTTKVKKHTLFTLSDLGSEFHSVFSAEYPYPAEPLVLLENSKQRVLFDWKQKKIVWQQTCEGETNSDWNSQSKAVAYVKADQLYVRNADDKELQLTTDGSRLIVYGSSVHRNEFGITKGTFWSPDGQRLAFYRMDQSMVSDYPQVDIFPRIAAYEPDKYPMAGETSHKVTVGVYDLNTQQTVYLQSGDPTNRYFTNISWSPDGQTIYMFELNRDQNDCQLVSYDAKTGQRKAELYRETSEKYVEPLHPIQFLPWDADKFIMQSQRDGYNHLYLYQKDGKLIRQLTSGQWVVQGVLGFNEKQKSIIIEANKYHPLHRWLYSVSVADGKMKELVSADGVHHAQLSASGRYLTDKWSSPTIPRTIDLIDTKNKVHRTPLLIPNSSFLIDYEQPIFECGMIKAADGKTDLFYRMVKPYNFDPAKQYPTIVYVYGGPHAHNVEASWHWSSRSWETYMSQKGYIIFILDNRGSEYRGRDFEQATFRQLGQIEMQDQMKGVDYLKSLPYVDMQRLGVHGWSFGGFMTISLMLNYPDVFKVGVAGGPVIDWKWYEVMYGERYMDTPQTNPEGYAKSSLIDKAKNLKGRLQIITGYNDKTVVPQHCLSFLDACVKAGTQPDFFAYPGEEHNMRGHASVHLHERITRYFEDYLK